MSRSKKTASPDPLIVIASNRGPFQFEEQEDGHFSGRRGAGGLVTALSALAEGLDVLWIACALSSGDRAWAAAQQERITRVDDIQMRLVIPDPEQYYQYYNIIANPLLWFIQHQLWDASRNPSIDAATWDAWHHGYVEINRLFARVIADSIRQALAERERPVLVFPQDYHFYMLPQFLREELGESVQIQPFLHIPWPGPDAWRLLPAVMRDAMLRSMLASDRIGFQTRSDAFNFVQTCRFYLEDAHSYGARDSIVFAGRKVEARTYPISIDVEKVDQLISEPYAQLQKAQMINLIGDRRLILRTDRVEPSKNILRGLQAYRILLEMHPELHDKVIMLALLVPSRMEVDEYQTYLRDIMAEAGLINAAFSNEIWEPVRVIVGDNYQRALAAMQLYDVLLVNPIADGMNLVAKEGVLVNQRDGVLVLSEHAGAFYELGEHALTLSPFDVYGTAQALYEALEMSREERQTRARQLEAIVRSSDVKQWFRHQVEDAMRALSSHSSNASTPETPSGTNKSADSRTASGKSSPTPTPKA